MKIRIYGKDQDADPPSIEFINDVEEYYCTNGMFYVRTKRNEAYYFSLELIAMIHVEPEESDVTNCCDKKCCDKREQGPYYAS